MQRLTPEQASLVESHMRVAHQAAWQATPRHVWYSDGTLNGEEAKSVAYIALCEAAMSWNGKKEFGGWAHMVISYRIIDWLRAAGQRGRHGMRPMVLSLDSAPIGWDINEETYVTPMARLDDRRAIEKMDDVAGYDNVAYLLSHLTPRLRQVVWMSCIQDMSLAEIGEVFGVSESRISQLRSRALRQLSRRIYDDDQHLAA